MPRSSIQKLCIKNSEKSILVPPKGLCWPWISLNTHISRICEIYIDKMSHYSHLKFSTKTLNLLRGTSKTLLCWVSVLKSVSRIKTAVLRSLIVLWNSGARTHGLLLGLNYHWSHSPECHTDSHRLTVVTTTGENLETLGIIIVCALLLIVSFTLPS